MIAPENVKKGMEVYFYFWTGFGFMGDPPACGEIRRVRARVTSKVKLVVGSYSNVRVPGVSIELLEKTGFGGIDLGADHCPMRLYDTRLTEESWIEELEAPPDLAPIELSRGTRLNHCQKEHPAATYRVKFQRSIKDPNQVRAVLEEDTLTHQIVARGPVVPIADYLTSLNAVLQAQVTPHLNPLASEDATQRWTKPRADGRPHTNEPVECAHCNHVYPQFNTVEIIKHCREHHREFYARKWREDIVPSGQDKMFPEYAPIPDK